MVPSCLEKLLAPLECLPHINLSLCNFSEIDERSQPISRNPRLQHRFLDPWMKTPSIRNGPAEFLLHAGFGTTVWCTMASVLIRRALLERVGLFRVDLGSSADEEWALRASLATDIVYVPGELTTWRVHHQQATNVSDQRQAARVRLAAIQSVLQDPKAGIPAQWKQVPDWDYYLTAVHYQAYRDELHLYRRELLRNPKRFLTGAWHAARYDFEWFSFRIGCGLSAGKPINRLTHVQRLLQMFEASWPPTPVPEHAPQEARAEREHNG
jgi:hypothetical protein